MPVLGLPKNLENYLVTLVDESNLSSWKICGQGTSTTIVLRFDSTPLEPTTAQYRRKPAAQVQRDQDRQRRFVQRKRAEQLAFPTDPPSAVNFSHTPAASHFQTTSNDNEVLPDAQVNDCFSSDHTSLPALFQPDLSTGTVTERQEIDDSINSLRDTGTDETTVSKSESESAATRAGFDTEIIKQLVGEVKDKSIQDSLRSHTRNKDFKKMVLDPHCYKGKRLLCLTDNLVLVYSCDNECLEDWFIINRFPAMKQRNILRTIDRGEHYPCADEELKESLNILSDIIRLYLG